MNQLFIVANCLLLSISMARPDAIAGQSAVDSLIELTNDIMVPEVRLTKLDSVCARAFRQKENDMDTLFVVGYRLGEELYGIPKNTTRAILAAKYFAQQGEQQKALTLLKAYYEVRENIPEAATRAALLAIYSNLLTNSFAFEPGIKVLEELVTLYEKEYTASPVEWGRANIDLGKNLFSIGRYGEASVHLNRARKFYQEANDSLGMKFSYNELGNLYGRIALYDEAVRQFREMERYDTEPSRVTDGIQAANIGRAYLEQKQYTAALKEYHKGMAARPFTDDDAYIELYLINGIIECQYYLVNQDSVSQYLVDLEAAYEESSSDSFYDFLLLQSRFFERTLAGDYPRAEKLLSTLYVTSAEYANDAELVAYSGYFADLYRRWGKYAKALTYQDSYTRITDSIRAANKTHALLLYQTEYETKEKEQQIQVLEAENELQALQARTNRNRFLFAGGGLLLFFGVLMMWQYFRNKVDRALRVERLRENISRDLHDDVGSILTGLAMKTELLAEELPTRHRPAFGEVTELSRSAMHRMRDAVWIMDSSRDSWQSLKERIQEFAYEILTPKDIAFSLKSKGSKKEEPLASNVRRQLYLITKEALANAVKHAPNATWVKVDFQLSKTRIKLTIENDGLMAISGKTSAGNGLRNMQQRAKDLGGTLSTERIGDRFSISFSGPRL